MQNFLKPLVTLSIGLVIVGMLNVMPLSAATANFSVHLSFETLNNAPTEYRQHARTLPVAGSDLLFTADLFKSGAGNTWAAQNPSNYIYEWTWRGVPKQTVGKTIFRATLQKIPDSQTIEVGLRVLDAKTKKVVAQEKLSIPIVSPEVLLYEVENGKIFGLASSTFRGHPGQTFTVLAQPYFFNLNSGDLTYDWRYQDNKISGADDPRFLQIKIPDGAGDYKQGFSVRVQSSQNLLELASKTFTIEVVQ